MDSISEGVETQNHGESTPLINKDNNNNDDDGDGDVHNAIHNT
jgi:hypothetical protein